MPRAVDREFFLIVRTDRILDVETLGSYVSRQHAESMMDVTINTAFPKGRKAYLLRVKPVEVLEFLEERG